MKGKERKVIVNGNWQGIIPLDLSITHDSGVISTPFFFFFFFCLLSFVVVVVVAISWATPAAYGGSQARG